MKPLLFAAAGLLLTSAPALAQTRTPLTLSGYNQDIIANGTYTASTVGSVTTNSTTTTVDGQGNVYYQRGYNTGNTALGLPTAAFTSNSNGSTTFQLAAATANNVLLLGGGTSGTLTLGTAGKFTALAFLVTGFDGSIPSSYTLNFSTGSATTGTFTALDNFDNTPFAIGGFDRARRGTGAFDNNTSNPRLYEVDLTLASGDIARTLQSITFGNTAASGNLAVFGVSATAVPEPATWLAGALLCVGAAWTFRRHRPLV